MVNPADAQRKADRKKEVKKNKAARTEARTEKLFSTPAALREEIEKWRKLRPGEVGEEGERLDPKSIANRIKKLEEAYAALLRKNREDAEAKAKAAASRPQVHHTVPLFEANPAPEAGAGAARRPEESVFYHPQLNPYGVPPPGQAQRWKTGPAGGLRLEAPQAQLALPAPARQPLPPLPPPPPPPPKALKPPKLPPAPPVVVPEAEVEAAPPSPTPPAPAPLPPPAGPPPLPPPAGPPPGWRPPPSVILPPPLGPPPGFMAAFPPPAFAYPAYPTYQHHRPPPPPPPPPVQTAALPVQATVAGAATVRVYQRAERDLVLTGMVPASVRVRREEAAPTGGGGVAGGAGPRQALAMPARPAGAQGGAPPPSANGPGYDEFMKEMAELGAM